MLNVSRLRTVPGCTSRSKTLLKDRISCSLDLVKYFMSTDDTFKMCSPELVQRAHDAGLSWHHLRSKHSAFNIIEHSTFWSWQDLLGILQNFGLKSSEFCTPSVTRLTSASLSSLMMCWQHCLKFQIKPYWKEDPMSIQKNQSPSDRVASLMKCLPRSLPTRRKGVWWKSWQFFLPMFGIECLASTIGVSKGKWFCLPNGLSTQKIGQ